VRVASFEKAASGMSVAANDDQGGISMRRYLSMVALAAAFVVPISGSVLADTETMRRTETTTVTEPTGRLVIVDEGTRKFRIGSETRVYVAPPSVDLDPLSGQDVKVFIDDGGQVSRITRVEERFETD
jgi:hypothetical protein